MAQQLDPWRTLGLAPGASLEEVRRAYRQLAKANHPDAAGEAAVPRFLAIQAAYEMLIRPGARRRPGTRPSATGTERPREPWQADPDRARASGRADGRRPGARPTGPRSTSGGAPAGPGGGTATGSRSGDRTGPSGTTGSAGSTSSGPTSSGSSRTRRPSGRRRAPNKATPYSTSYDPGDEEPFEPGWSGAGWYGAASGTYWTINPKEWADPRKHGPEYQRRARRAAGGWILDDDGDTPEPGEGAATDATADEPTRDQSPRPDASWTDAGAAGDEPPAAAEPVPETPPASRIRLDWRSWISQPPPGSRFRGPILRPPSGNGGRLIVAFLGWAGLASIAATILGEATGCSRFSVSCDDAAAPMSSLVLAGLFLALLALPAVATWLAHGTIAVFLFGIPASILLSATGGANQPEASAAVVTAVTVVAWIAGVVYAAVLPRLGTVGTSDPPA